MSKVDLWDDSVQPSAKEIAERLMSEGLPTKKRRKRSKKENITETTEAVETPVNEVVTTEPEKVEVVTEIPPEKVETILVEEPEDDEPMVIINPEGDYVVTAGIARATERQLFLSTWRDSDTWSICVVPTTLTYERCEYMIQKATEEIIEKAKRVKIKQEPNIPPFEIVHKSKLNIK